MIGNYAAMGLAPGSRIKSWQPVLKDTKVSRKGKPKQRPLKAANFSKAELTHMMSHEPQEPLAASFPPPTAEQPHILEAKYQNGNMLNIIPAGMYVRQDPNHQELLTSNETRGTLDTGNPAMSMASFRPRHSGRNTDIQEVKVGGQTIGSTANFSAGDIH